MCQRVDFSRFGVIVLGYVAASVAAGLVMGGALVAQAGSVGGFADILAGWIMAAGVMIPFAFVLALPPAVAFILYAERHGIQSPIAYAISGALAGIYVPACIAAYSLFMVPNRPPGAWGLQHAMSYLELIGPLFLLPGICGGLAYWATAGRTTA
jgi:hypothetical protein